MFDQVAALDTSKTTWRLKVRVTRMWPSISNSAEAKESLKGYNLILLDDNNCHVHAFIYADTWKGLADKIAEGGIYIISNFFTKEAFRSLKPVSSKIVINFSHSTTVQKIKEDDDCMIPVHKFEFVDLGDLFGVASTIVDVDYPEYSTDIIGVLEDFEHVRPIQTKYGQRNIVKFRITDGRHSHKVTVWGDLAVKTDASHRDVVERPIIVILASTKMKIYKNSVQISTLPSSKVYLNLDNDIVRAMRQRLDEEGYTPAQQALATPIETIVYPIIETVTLKELGEKTGTEYTNKNVLCNVKIRSVEESNWWYYSCIDCQTEVEKQEGRLRCSTCKKTVPVAEKRYRIVILAEDSTEAYNFILLDRAAKRMIGVTATKMIADMLQTNTSFPTKIKEINGKEVQLNVLISEENIISNSRLYSATDAYETCNSTSTMSEATMPGYGSSSSGYNSMVELSECGNTPISAKSSVKKIKVEK